MEKLNALVIDDEIDISNLFSFVLNLVGYECEVANTVKDGLTIIASSTPSLVLLDLQLGGALGGQDILYQIRSNPRLKDTLVIVVTGFPAMAEPVLKLADFILTKPINIEHLKSVITGLKTRQPTGRRNYFCDPITGMYNADFFITRLEHATERSRRRLDFIFAVCIIAVNVKQVNTNRPVGRTVFDTVLSDATQGLVHSLRPTDTVARLSNSKLATLHEELTNPEDIKAIVRRIQTILMPPFTVENQKYQLETRIGKATNKEFYSKPEDLLALAEHDLETH